jgi:ubiquinone/menaquinone biosynthesis C-methylase UbiE
MIDNCKKSAVMYNQFVRFTQKHANFGKTYRKWYTWFSYIYDYFMKVMCIPFYGFDGERKFRESVVNWIYPQQSDNILDICSGTGTLTIMIAERLARKGKVIGIELFPKQLKLAQRKPMPGNLTFIAGDARHMPFSNNSFDKSVICGALHEMPQNVRHNVLSEAYRLVKPGGTIVIVEQNKPDKKWKAWLFNFLERFNPEYITYRNLLECGLRNEIKQVGFRILKTDTLSWEFFQIVLAEKCINGVSGHGIH